MRTARGFRAAGRGHAARGLALLVFFAAAMVAAAAEGPDISGIVETRASGAATPDYGDGAGAAFGFEQYANLRLKARVGEAGTVYAATNLIAAAGDQALDAEAFAVGENYAAALELERLYYRIEGEAFAGQAGLMRLAFGYGQAFRPTDFLSPPNPLLPDARPRGVLGGTVLFYPRDEWKAAFFAATGKDPTEADGDGLIAGISTDFHTDRTSFQALYAAEAAGKAIHRFGLSVKVEAGAGIVLDALYTLDGEVVEAGRWYDRDWTGLQGLEASLGADYSVLDTKLYLLLQYLYHGAGALDVDDDLAELYSSDGGAWTDAEPDSRAWRMDIPLSQLNRKNYLYAMASYSWNDYTSTALSCVASLDDLSFSPLASVEHEPFQGLTVGLSLRVPVDGHTFSGSGDYGELGPTQTGMNFQAIATAKLRF